ncbi:HlyD family secretion protein [Aestuariibius insulae]|uniref:HlyD family secretion protein n=1 Tax=Aestuariibius insulae TaxID=2058287 RepID=UPI00345E2335
MITRLKCRPRTDSHRNEIRVHRWSWDRTIYLVVLGGFFAMLLNYLAGDRLILRADGLVLRDRIVVAATSLVSVTEVQAQPGQWVEAGDILLRAESTTVLDRLADLALRRAELDERLAKLIGEAALAQALAPLARERLETLEADTLWMIGSDNDRLVNAARRAEIEDRLHAARTELRRLETRDTGLNHEIAAVRTAAEHADADIARLRSHYNGGVRRAPREGVVGSAVPAEGEVFRPGEPITSLLSGGQYVLAYLPRHYLFSIAPGEPVRVMNGSASVIGKIDAILPVSAAIPDEFHNSFRARERKQLARIALPQDSPFPIHSTVRIRSDFDLRGRLSALISQVGALRADDQMASVTKTEQLRSPK